MAEATWREFAEGVYVRHYEELELNCGLVVGEQRALVVDTRSTAAQGAELAAAVREVTPLEAVVVNTHAHHDHCFGNVAFRDSQIYSHVGAADDLLATSEQQRGQVVEQLRRTGHHQLAQEIRETEIVLPFYLVDTDTAIDLGGRRAHLLHGGRAHTDHDLAVAVPDAGVVFWGDLVEQGADPAMEDAYPLEWADTLRALLSREQARDATVAVPGHGEVIGPADVGAQTDRLGHLADWLTEALLRGVRDVDALVAGGRGLGLQDPALRTAAVRALETSA